MATTWSLIGLGLDIVGAVLLAFGLLTVNMARIRQANGPVSSTWYERPAVKLAEYFGSTDPRATESYSLPELAATLYGVALLVVGFVFQAAGQLAAAGGGAR